jgi:hypothetical protein
MAVISGLTTFVASSLPQGPPPGPQFPPSSRNSRNAIAVTDSKYVGWQSVPPPQQFFGCQMNAVERLGELALGACAPFTCIRSVGSTRWGEVKSRCGKPAAQCRLRHCTNRSFPLVPRRARNGKPAPDSPVLTGAFVSFQPQRRSDLIAERVQESDKSG